MYVGQSKTGQYLYTVFHRIDAAPCLIAALEWAPHNPIAERNSGRPRIDAARLSAFMTTWCISLLRVRSLVIIIVPSTSSLADVCGISACVDNRDSSIHCLKSGGVASEAMPTITENTASLISEVQRQDDDDRDLFADLDDDEEEFNRNKRTVRTCRQYR